MKKSFYEEPRKKAYEDALSATISIEDDIEHGRDHPLTTSRNGNYTLLSRYNATSGIEPSVW